MEDTVIGVFDGKVFCDKPINISRCKISGAELVKNGEGNTIFFNHTKRAQLCFKTPYYLTL